MAVTLVSIGNTDPVETSGTQPTIQTSDSDTLQLLNDTIKELKKMNLQMSLMTDTEVTNADVE